MNFTQKERIRQRFLLIIFGFILSFGRLNADEGLIPPSPIKDPAELQLAGDWQVKVSYKGKIGLFEISPSEAVTITNEKHDQLAVFNPNGPSWRRGTALDQVKAQECAVENAVVPGTVSLRLNETGEPLTEGEDYITDLPNGNIGRTETGKIGADTPIFVSYQYVPMRIDSIILTTGKKLDLVIGIPHAVNPAPPALKEGEIRLANIFISGQIEKLTDDNLFPILDDGKIVFPDKAEAEKLLPKTWEKLQNGETVLILAWGDSVTECGYIPDDQRWQAQFAARLQARFPNAKIELISEGWGGRCTNDFFAQPAGAPHNYQEKILDRHPDLIVSEFVNDAGLSLENLQTNYQKIKRDFSENGIEWIILSPHYIRPSWMGISSQKGIDQDPRPLTAFLREFTAENQVAFADASVLYGRLWRQGIPYITLMKNNINHPNEFGMSLFADALMSLFGRE